KGRGESMSRQRQRAYRRVIPVVLGCVLGCQDETSSGGAPDAGAAPSASQSLLVADEEDQAPARPQKKGAATRAGERLKIPAGKLVSGSTPGDRGRDPSFEPALVEVELTAFEIDLLPHPNDPAQRPK